MFKIVSGYMLFLVPVAMLEKALLSADFMRNERFLR